MPTSSVNFLEELPDVVFYAVMGKLPGWVIENTVRQLSRNCYRKIELCRARLPRVYIKVLDVRGNTFSYRRPDDKERNVYAERIDPTNLIQHLEYLKKRATFETLCLRDVNWDMFANCEFQCEELTCWAMDTTLSPERFTDIFRSIRPTRKLGIYAYRNNKIFPVTTDFFTDGYAIGLQDVLLCGSGNAMVNPLNDTILLDSTFPIFRFFFSRNCGFTLNGILAMIRDWYTSERQVDYIELQVVGGEAQHQNFWHNLAGLLVDKRLLYDGCISSRPALERVNGDVLKLSVHIRLGDYLNISMVRLVPGPEAGLYRRYDDVE